MHNKGRTNRPINMKSIKRLIGILFKDYPVKTVIIVPLTSVPRKLPTRIPIKATTASGLPNDSYAVLDQLKTVDKSRILSHIGEISESEKHAVSEILKEMFHY